MDNHYYESGNKLVRKPRARINHCVVCQKKRNLLYYTTTNELILQICNKCLDAFSEPTEEGKKEAIKEIKEKGLTATEYILGEDAVQKLSEVKKE